MPGGWPVKACQGLFRLVYSCFSERKRSVNGSNGGLLYTVVVGHERVRFAR